MGGDNLSKKIVDDGAMDNFSKFDPTCDRVTTLLKYSSVFVSLIIICCCYQRV